MRRDRFSGRLVRAKSRVTNPPHPPGPRDKLLCLTTASPTKKVRARVRARVRAPMQVVLSSSHHQVRSDTGSCYWSLHTAHDEAAPPFSEVARLQLPPPGPGATRRDARAQKGGLSVRRQPQFEKYASLLLLHRDHAPFRSLPRQRERSSERTGHTAPGHTSQSKEMQAAGDAGVCGGKPAPSPCLRQRVARG